MTGWTVIVPVKGGPLAKSRLPELVRGTPRSDIARALAEDTVAAIAAADAVVRVLVVTAVEDPRLALPASVERRLQIDDGLDAAVAGVARTLDGPVAVILGDLPALRPEDVDEALARAAAARRAVIADAAGTGTTLLAAVDGRILPAFGARSLARHRALGYSLLAGSPRLRADVDTERDLDRAGALGLGRRTAAVLGLLPAVNAG